VRKTSAKLNKPKEKKRKRKKKKKKIKNIHLKNNETDKKK